MPGSRVQGGRELDAVGLELERRGRVLHDPRRADRSGLGGVKMNSTSISISI